MPLRANLLTFTARINVASIPDKITLLNEAALMDKCNPEIINELAYSYVLNKNMPMAAVTYGQAMMCSPGDSLLRFKYGEALLEMNMIEGRENIREAWFLEPNNPVYISELTRVMALR